MKIEKDGKTYILQERVEEIIQSRIAKHSSKSSELESKLAEYQKQIEAAQKQAEAAQNLQQKLTDLEGKLATSQNKYNRYTSISRQGITDPQLVKLLEWSYDEDMRDLKKADQKPLGEWLQGYIENPNTAPITIRPHLPQQYKEGPKVETEVAAAAEPTSTQAPAPSKKPAPSKSVNQGALPAPEISSHFDRMKDLNYYSNNRDEIRRQWYDQFKKR
tara:strand:+ start:905 stop:1555 length:651 start_codon:yes stop_codon:yes gene_type:complete